MVQGEGKDLLVYFWVFFVTHCHSTQSLYPRRVVVKVKFPRAEPLLRGDVRTIKAFAQLAQPVHVPALEQVEKQVSSSILFMFLGLLNEEHTSMFSRTVVRRRV